jgi:hypothetical protein
MPSSAREYSREVFDQAQQIASSTEDPTLRNLLRDTLATRDQITADLAKGDAAALSEIQPLLSKLERLRTIDEERNEKPARGKPAFCWRITQAWLRFGYRTWGCVVEPILVPITSPDTINSTRRFC